MRNRDDSGPEKDSVEQLVDDYTARQITRRDFFKRSAALGITVSVAGALLAACGGDDEEAAAPPAEGEPPAETPPADTAAGRRAAGRGAGRRAGHRRTAHRGLRPRLHEDGHGSVELGRSGLRGALRVHDHPRRGGWLPAWRWSSRGRSRTTCSPGRSRSARGSRSSPARRSTRQVIADNFNVFRDPATRAAERDLLADRHRRAGARRDHRRRAP